MKKTRTRVIAGTVLLVMLAVAFQAGQRTRAQSETQPEYVMKHPDKEYQSGGAPQKPGEAVEHQKVIVVADISPANLASEVHKLNDKGETIDKSDITIGSDGKMMIWLMDSPGEEE